MDEIIETYVERPLATLTSLLFIALGIFTLLKYQEVEVPNLQAFLFQSPPGMLPTFALNLFSSVGLGASGFFWVKSVFSYNPYNTAINNIVSILWGLSLIIFALIFANFIFHKMLILLLICIVGALYFYKK